MHFNLSAISKQTTAGRLLRLPLRLLPSKAVVPILQGPLARRRWIIGAGVHGYWLGSYEYDKQKRFADSAAAAHVICDIGAHVGFYTLLASVSVRPDGQVFAFEPLPQNMAFLKEHVRLNRCDNVRVYPYAVSDHSGTVKFHVGPNSSMGQISDDGTHIVPVVSVDDLVDAGTIPAPDLLKIDVEGEEGRVLAGAERTIGRSHPTIFLATHSSDLHRHCTAWLEDRNYLVRAVADDELVASPR